MNPLDLDRRTFIERSLGFTLTAGTAVHAQSSSAAVPPAQPGSTLRFFPGFKPISVKTSGATINGVMGGSGPPLLLLHGWPQSHVEWQAMAPLLAKDFTVVATDLRGYGDSSVPPDGENHAGYSKRAMAQDQVEVMQSLGFEKFLLIGHDRGGRVGHRLALDHPEKVRKLVVLDIVPTYRLLTQVTTEFARAYFHWFFLIQPAPIPETLLLNSAEFFLRGRFGTSRRAGVPSKSLIPEKISEDAFGEYLRSFRRPASMHAMCEDYRAAATIDLEHDRHDLHQKVTCPLLTIWGKNGAMDTLYDVTATWRERAADVRGVALPGGHWLPEELPAEVHAECRRFLQAG